MGDGMKYKINFTMDFSAYVDDKKRWLQHMTLHYVEVPFVRQHTGEWQYLPNWHAKRDKNYMNAEKAPESWK